MHIVFHRIASNDMEFFYFVHIFIICIFAHLSNSQHDVYRLCVDSRKIVGRTCQALQKGNSQVTCVPVTDSVDCALKLQNGQADFGLFTAEEALLASKFINEDVEVIGELRHRDKINDSFAFQAVVVLKGDSLQVHGKNYCHPGFRPGQLWTDRILKDFETIVVERQYGKHLSSSYDEIFSLSKYFNKACRPGRWAMDDLLEHRLKQEFPSLCELCDSPSRCSYNDESHGSHIAALNCLTKRGGDIAYVALQYVKEYFGLIPGFQPKAPANQYRFLCPNFKIRSLYDTCSWLKQPWTSVIVSKKKSASLRRLLPGWLNSEHSGRGNWEEVLETIIEGPDYSFRLIQNSTAMTTYIQEGRSIPVPSEIDENHRVRLCIANDTDTISKCQWIQQAVLTHGVKPELSCVPASSVNQCFQYIRDNKADIVSVDSDYGFIARREYNLSPVMYQDSTNDGNFKMLTVIRADNKEIRNISDLKGKKACFPSYNKLAWLSFLDVMKTSALLPDMCPYSRSVANFFSEACVPGFVYTHNDSCASSVTKKLCSLCEVTNGSRGICASESNNKFYGDTGALMCLMTGVADVAFIDYRNLMSDNKGTLELIVNNQDKFKVLCRNGTVVNSTGFEVEENCAFAVGTGAEVIGRKFCPKELSNDIVELLLKMDDWMGETIYNYLNVINMYGPFNNKIGLIFKDTTVNMVPIYDHNYNYIQSYKELQNSVNSSCTAHCSSSASAPHGKFCNNLIYIILIICYKLLRKL